MRNLQERHAAALQIVDQAAAMALGFFTDRDALNIEVKGLQDWVSNADKSVEDFIRAQLALAFPDDGIIGEEHGRQTGDSGYTWVIDPIDGTTNFVNGIPGWCVVLALVNDGQTVSGVIRDPVSNETYAAMKGTGATLNKRRLSVSQATSLEQGTLGVGHSNRVAAEPTVKLLDTLLRQGGLFRRGGSGALDLAYVAAGRLVGFVEPHMNAWDCLAAILLIEEAGGRVQHIPMDTMLKHGGRVVAACASLFERIEALCNDSYGDLHSKAS